VRRAEYAAEAGWCEAGVDVESGDRAAIDQQHGRAEVLGVVLLLEDAHHDIHGQFCLETRLIGRRGYDPVAPNAAMDTGAEVIGDHLDPFRKAAPSQHLYGGLCGDGRADDVIEVLIPVEDCVDQPGLFVDARVAEPRLDDRNVRPFYRVAKTLITNRHPSRSCRPREPSDPDRLVHSARQCLEVVAGGESHVVEVRADARRDRSGAHAVDEIDDGDVPVRVAGNEIVQTVRGDGPKDYRLSAATNTFGDLSPLRLQ